MKKGKIAPTIGIVLLTVLSLGCSERDVAANKGFTDLAQQGKEVFESQGCNQCHYVGDESVKAEAPDLTDPFFANDSLFVQAHLSFIDESKMPAITLTAKEKRLVSYYVAELHASKQTVVNGNEADERCAVCYAPLSSLRAQNDNLKALFLGNNYYFECQECFDVFLQAPEAFVELLRQYEFERTAEVSVK